MVLLSVSTPTKLSLFDQDPSQPFQLPTAVALPTLHGAVVCSAWSKEKGAFAVATSEGSVYVWDDAAGRPKECTQVVKGLKDDLPITALLLDSHEGLVALYSQGSKVHVVDCRSFKRLAPLEHYPSLINNISLSSDGLAVAAGHESGQVVIFNRQHGTHQSISLSPRAPVALAQLHPSKRNILLVVQRTTPSKLLIYDLLRASSPLKSLSLAKPSSTGHITALAFHGSGSHAALVTDAGELFTVNLESGSKKETNHKVPLTSVIWTGRSSVVLGTETGRLLLRDAQDASSGSDLTFGEGGDPIVSLTVQPGQAKPVRKKKTLGESSAVNQSSAASSSAHGRTESTASRRMSKNLSSSTISSDAHPSSSSRHHPQSTPSSTSNASSTYNPTPSSSTHASSHKSFNNDVEPTSSHPLSRQTQMSNTAARGGAGTAKPKRVLWGDEEGGGSGADESTPRRSTTSPPPPRPSPPRASPSSRLREGDRNSSPTHYTSGRTSAASNTHTHSRSPSPPHANADASHYSSSPANLSITPRQQHFGGDDSPLIYAMSAQIKNLHLDMLKARRETRREMKGMFKQHFGEVKELREENERLKVENERLRRGY